MSPDQTDVALLCLRLLAAYYLLGHGAKKLGLAGGAGLERTALFFASAGYRPGRFFALVAAATEIGTALLLALGLATPLAAVGAVAMLGCASLAVPGDVADDPRVELARVLAIVPAGLALAGPGDYSLDRVLGFELGLVPSVVLLALALLSVPATDRLVRRPPAAPSRRGGDAS